MTTRFTSGFRVRMRDDVRRVDADLLVGGSPLRAVRLTPAAQERIERGTVTVTDAASAALAARLLDGNLADPEVTGPCLSPDLVTVVIPARDRAEQLEHCLTPLTGMRCLVVDDHSHRPETVQAVAAGHGATVLRLPRNVGPASARNAGLRQVTTPYVAFVDSDVTVDAATLLRLTRHFADVKVALVGPLVRSRTRSTRPRWFERFDEQVSSLDLGSRACSVRPGAAVGWLPSACLVGRTDRLRPGFTEGMRVGEDVDLVWRLVDSDQVVRYDPTETAWHDTRDTVRGWLSRKFIYGTGGAALAARHGRKGAPAVLTVPMGLAAAGVLMARWWSPAAAVAGLAYGWVQLDRRLPESRHRRAEAARLSTHGLGWALRQEAALLLRHWWPAAAAAALGSPTARRAVAAALVVDTVAARIDHPDSPYAPVSRQLDHLAYGAGLWWGALQHRSIRCLLPRKPGGQ